MLRKFTKNKRAQAALEFCLCIPIILLMTLGVLDVAKVAIIKMETTQAMQANLSLASADGKDANDGNTVKKYAASYIMQTSMFCTHVKGYSTPSCASKTDNTVQTTLRLEAVNGTLQAGNQICMAAKSEFKPHYSGVYSDKTMAVYSRACTMMETSKKSAAGWVNGIAAGRW